MSESKPVETRAAEELYKYLDSTGRLPRRRVDHSVGRTCLFWDAPEGHQSRAAIERLARKGGPELIRWRLPGREITSLAVSCELPGFLSWLVSLAEVQTRFQPPYPETCQRWSDLDPPVGFCDPDVDYPLVWTGVVRRYGWTARASQACQVRQ